VPQPAGCRVAEFHEHHQRDAAPTVERELVELKEWPRRWFSRIAELVQIESEFQRSQTRELSSQQSGAHSGQGRYRLRINCFKPVPKWYAAIQIVNSGF
jgi:hypothetical protein